VPNASLVRKMAFRLEEQVLMLHGCASRELHVPHQPVVASTAGDRPYMHLCIMYD
jgi:hypothetical protein